MSSGKTMLPDDRREIEVLSTPGLTPGFSNLSDEREPRDRQWKVVPGAGRCQGSPGADGPSVDGPGVGVEGVEVTSLGRDRQVA